MAIKNMQTGFFVNAQANYFAAPQQLNGQGQIQGHSHVVIEQLSALDQTTPTDPKKFAFFKGLNAAAQGGKLTADVPDGLQPGFYKLSSINTAANHQPVIVPVAQHGSLDDAIYVSIYIKMMYMIIDLISFFSLLSLLMASLWLVRVVAKRTLHLLHKLPPLRPPPLLRPLLIRRLLRLLPPPL